VKCTRCGCENPERAKFCLECGAALSAGCATCGTELPPSARFCLECGAAVAQAAGVGPASGALGPEAAGAARRTPAAATSLPPRAPTPGHLADKIRQARASIEGERKQVTVLFADVTGSMGLAELSRPGFPGGSRQAALGAARSVVEPARKVVLIPRCDRRRPARLPCLRQRPFRGREASFCACSP